MLLNDFKNREFSIMELFRIAVSLTAKNYKKILLIVLIICFPLNIFLSFISGKLYPIIYSIDFDGLAASSELMQKFAQTNEFKTIAIYYFVMDLVRGLFVPLMSMAVAYLIKNYIMENDISVKEAVLESFSRGHVLIISVILYNIMFYSGFVCFIIPGERLRPKSAARVVGIFFHGKRCKRDKVYSIVLLDSIKVCISCLDP